MQTCFGYIRVSTLKQGATGVSLDQQKEEIRRYAAANRLDIVEWFEERETAAKSGRPVFNRMVKALQAQPIVGVVFHKIDRSARNFRDWARIGELNDAGVNIYFATETLDFRSRGGRLSADIQAVIAADYIRNLRDETLKGIRGRLNQGLYPFKAPLGYLDNGRGKPKTPDPARARLITTLFQLYASGEHSILSLRTAMIAHGLTNAVGNPPSKHLIETILSNPFYCGVIRIKSIDQTFPGIHEPLIPVPVFQRVQAVKAGKAGKKVTKHDHLFRGLFACGHCAKAMIGELQYGYVYYRCHTPQCPTKTIREDAAEARIIDSLKIRHLSDAAIDQLVAFVSDWLNRDINADKRLAALKAEEAALADKLVNLSDALISGLIDRTLFSTHKEAILLQQRSLAAEKEKQLDLIAAPDDVRRFLEVTNNLVSLYRSLVHAEKRQFLKCATSKRLVYGKSLELEPSDWLQTAKQSVAAPYGDPRRPQTRRRPLTDQSFIDALIKAARNDNVKELRALGHDIKKRQDGRT